jgi:DNA uptake protein ComE-like DNA-binding protein
MRYDRRGRWLLLPFAMLACVPDADVEPGTAADSAAVADSALARDTASTIAADSSMLDPDQATREQLAALPGMTPALADSLVARRPFTNMLVVDSIVGRTLGEEQRDTLYTRLWKPLDLNSANAAEIELIPGVGARMRGEFEEYRPYTDLAEFRREIGKYVDEVEVARLERYVTIR